MATFNELVSRWLSNMTPGGAALVTTQSPAAWEFRSVLIDDAGDVITNLSAPLAAEIIKLDNFPAGAKFARLTWHCQKPAAATDIPFASAAMITWNASDTGDALARFTYTGTGGGGTGSSDSNHLLLSADNPVVEIDLTGTDATLSNIYVGGMPVVGAGALPVRINVGVRT